MRDLAQKINEGCNRSGLIVVKKGSASSELRTKLNASVQEGFLFKELENGAVNKPTTKISKTNDW